LSRDAERSPAGELRSAFDEAFSRPAEPSRPAAAAALALRAGGRPLAVPMRAVAGLFRDVAVIRLPTPRSELLGIASLRGVAAPVYDLARLLGFEASRAPVWHLLLRGDEPAAVAFDSFEGQFELPGGSATSPGDSALTPRGTVDPWGVLREVLEVEPVLDQIRRLARPPVEES